MLKEKNVKGLAEKIRAAKGRGTKVCLLIGAGVSKSAGIEDADGFVKIIREKHALSYEEAKANCDGSEPSYAECMRELTEAERRTLVNSQVQTAKINWAHIGIALLEEHGFVDRILSVNFDPLASRACALLNRFPSIYDFAALQHDEGDSVTFLPSFVEGSAIYHLHGQHTGFVLLNTEEKLRKQAQGLRPVLEEAMPGRLVIVCGYSGANDPLVEKMHELGPYHHGLFWFCKEDSSPPAFVRDTLLAKQEDCFLLRGDSADNFFIALARELKIFPPRIINQPFDHLMGVLDKIKSFTFVDEEGSDLLATTRSRLLQAKQRDEVEFQHVEKATDMMAREEYSGVLVEFLDVARRAGTSNALKNVTAWAAIMDGNLLSERAERAQGEEANRLFDEAAEKYQAAVSLEHNRHEAFNNWGSLLSERAERAEGEDADQLFDEAAEKYQAAFEINSDDRRALNNWGSLLRARAERAEGEDADRLFDEAAEKFQAAININPNDHRALNNWGDLLVERAERAEGEDADQLFDEAAEKFQAAIDINPDDHRALNNWGALLSMRAKQAQGEDADRFFDEAMEKYQAAVSLEPNRHEALNNWGSLLRERAERTKGEDADRFFDEAAEKFQAAIDINPDDPVALNNLGTLLSERAERAEGEDADRFLDEATEKYQAAFDINPDDPVALSNWGTSLSLRAERAQGEDADRFFDEATVKYQAAFDINPDDPVALTNWGNLLRKRAERAQGEDADRFFDEAEAKYRAVLDINPDDHEALHNLGAFLADRVRQAQGGDADRFFDEAEEKCREALDIRPDDYRTLSNLGALLCLRAKRAQGGDADRFFDEAEEKYREGLDIRPDDVGTLNNLGTLLSERAKRAQGEDAERFFDQAEEILKRSETLLTGSAAYNLACVCAVRGNISGAREWMETAAACNQLPDSEHILSDDDLEGIRDEPWFRDILEWRN